MAINRKTADGEIDVSFNDPPEFAMNVMPISHPGSTGTSVRLLSWVAAGETIVVGLAAYPKTIASGTLKVDLLVDGVSILTTPATATVADTPVPPVFASTRIATGSLVVIATTSDSSTVTDVWGHIVIRPLLGAERRNP